MNRKLERELGKRIKNFDYERDDANGSIVFPKTGVSVAGLYFIDVLTRDDGPVYAPNLVTAQGLDYLAAVALHDQAKINTWYIAPFAGNVTPASSVTGETFATATSEFINYSEATRPAFAPAAVADGVIDNFATKAEITVGADAQTAIYGLGMLSASGRGAATPGSICFSATRLPSPRTGLVENDVIALGYRLTAADAS